MNSPRILFGLSIGLLFLYSAAHAQDAAAPTQSVPVVKPQRPAIKSKAVAEFCRRHHTAKTLSFTATYSSNFGPDLAFINLNTYAVQAKRPNLIAVRGGPTLMREVTNGNSKQVSFYGDGRSVCVSDGKSQIEMDPRLHAYEKSPAPANFDLSRAVALMYIRADISLASDILDGYEPAPDEEIYLRPVLVFKRVFPQKAQRTETEKLYFSADTGELVRCSVFSQYKETSGETDRVEYNNWKFNARLPGDAFALILPADAKPFSALVPNVNPNPQQ